MKKFSFKIRGHKYDVEVLSQESNMIELEINGSQYSIELEKEIQVKKTPTLVRSSVSTHKDIQSKQQSGVYKVKCPLPGNIMSVMVKEGDTIKIGDKLVIYEAMKMENVVVSEKAGVVSKIKVNVGDTVVQEATLLEISL